MKTLKVIFILLLVLAVIFVMGSFFLPKSYRVERRISIQAPDSVVFKNIANFNEFIKWNPWTRMDPNAKVEIDGAIETVGHHYVWRGEKTGTGEMKILSLARNEKVNMELKFIKPMKSMAMTNFDIVPEANNRTTVVWVINGENKNIVGKWMSLFMDRMIGRDFDDGLKNLKEISEASQRTVGSNK